MSDDPIRPELAEALSASRSEAVGPGAWWTGPERAAITHRARTAFTGAAAKPGSRVPSRTGQVIDVLATRPAHIDQASVDEVVEEIGEPRYVELVGLVARTVAVDTFDRLRGVDPPPSDPPRNGEPSEEPAPEAARRNRTWVSMVVPSPPFVLGSVPSAERAMNALCDQLYLSIEQISDPNFARGSLSRPQIELVATTTSRGNECFY